jgi:hypothetical protein
MMVMRDHSAPTDYRGVRSSQKPTSELSKPSAHIVFEGSALPWPMMTNKEAASALTLTMACMVGFKFDMNRLEQSGILANKGFAGGCENKFCRPSHGWLFNAV